MLISTPGTIVTVIDGGMSELLVGTVGLYNGESGRLGPVATGGPVTGRKVSVSFVLPPYPPTFATTLSAVGLIVGGANAGVVAQVVFAVVTASRASFPVTFPTPAIYTASYGMTPMGVPVSLNRDAGIPFLCGVK